jgi:Protein of unknown function (DUF992)
MRKLTIALVAFAAFALTLSAVPSARAAEESEGTVKIGYLSCNVASGWGVIFGSSRKLECTYTSAVSGQPEVEHYKGSISKFGADIGYLQSGVILWTVFAPAHAVTHKTGLLAGHYAGGTASATVGIGAAAHALIGGMDSSISLQPVSVEGNTGLNVAAGVAMMNLEYVGEKK